jgi:hypothetical protein
MRLRFLAAMGLTAACHDPPPTATPSKPVASAAPVDLVDVGPAAPIDAGVEPTADVSPPDASVAIVAPPKPPATPVPAGWWTSFPRRGPHPSYCPNESAYCVEGTGDISKCARSSIVPCDHGHGAWNENEECQGPLLENITRTERSRTKHAHACCYDMHSRCPHPAEGRPLRASLDDAPILAPVTTRDTGWSATRSPGRLDPARASRWSEAARFEHASVASFAKLALDLLRHGAPPELLEATHRAAIDEIDHARRSFELAARFDGGAPRGPGPLAVPELLGVSLHDLARETLRDGCVGETLAAARAAREHDTSDDVVERETLAVIARDEESHAELAFRILAWTATKDASVLDGLEDEAQALGDALPPVDREVVALVVLPCLRGLLSDRGAACDRRGTS